MLEENFWRVFHLAQAGWQQRLKTYQALYRGCFDEILPQRQARFCIILTLTINPKQVVDDIEKNKIQEQNMLDCYKMQLHMQRTSQDREKNQ